MKKIAYLIITLIIMMPLSGCLDNSNNSEDAIQGEQGEIGPQGPPGQDGVNGSDGVSGIPGVDGQNGNDGQDGANGTNGLNSLIELVNETSGDNCEHGGLRVNSGLDDNRDGILQLEEIDNFSFICQPSDIDSDTDEITIQFDENAILGSWRSAMKHNTVTLRSQLGSCAEHDAWVRTNESAMMEMMNNTNQNTYVAHIGGSVGGCEYLSMLDLLDAANHTEEDRNIWIGLKNWQTMPQYLSIIENYSVQEVESNVGKGIVIDDYGEMIYNPWTKTGEMNNSNLQEFKQSTLHQGNYQADIIPYIGAKHAIMFGGKSAVLGVGPCPSGACDGGNNYTLRVEDSISVTWNFSIPTSSETSDYQLKGLAYDTLAKSFPDRDLFLNISLNGDLVNSFSLSDITDDDDGIMLIDTVLPNLLIGSNQITFWLNASNNTITKHHSKLVFLTDLSLEHTNGYNFALDIEQGWYKKERFSPNVLDDYHHSEPNTNWIQSGNVDGFLFKWIEPSEDIVPVIHQRFVDWFCGNLQAEDKLCIQVFWGDKQWLIDNPGEADDYLPILQNLADYSDGLLVWRMDNQQYDMENGIYAETRAADETYYIAGMYPSYMPATEDWFQQWEFNTQNSGLLEIEINDLIYNTALQGRMLVTVIIDETDVYVHDLGDAELQSTFSTQVDSGDNVKIKFHTIDSFGSVNWWTGIDVQLNSAPIAIADLSYTSGSSEHVAFIYDLMTTTFLGEDLSNFIIE
jgi:hypothetical protein|tara:strand:+ start:968 stop:3187 length:2220 start_codon:yes stop_codon:yes gene_type:complete